MIHIVAMGRRRKIGVCTRILALRVLFASIIGLSAPFVVHAQSDERTEEIADDSQEITGAKTREKPGFLFAPIPISEPVLGTGLAVTGLLIYKPPRAGQFASHAGLFGGGTSNGTWAVGALNSMKLREDSIRVETVIAESSWTLPSHLSLLSGLPPAIHGVTLPTQKVAPDVPLLAEVLRARGFRTFAWTGGAFVARRLGPSRGSEHWDERGRRPAARAATRRARAQPPRQPPARWATRPAPPTAGLCPLAHEQPVPPADRGGKSRWRRPGARTDQLGSSKRWC